MSSVNEVEANRAAANALKTLVVDRGYALNFKRCTFTVDHDARTVTVSGMTPKDRAERRRRKK